MADLKQMRTDAERIVSDYPFKTNLPQAHIQVEQYLALIECAEALEYIQEMQWGNALGETALAKLKAAP